MSSNTSNSIPITRESLYSFPVFKTQQPQDFTPHSAVCFPENYSMTLRDFFNTESDPTNQVSSFNLPAQTDANLFTPVSMTNSPLLPIKTTMALDRDVEIKLSPTSISPNYDIFGNLDDEDYSPRFNAAMKPKAAYSGHHISISGSSLAPESPSFCTSPHIPYFGIYGVSAPSQQTQTSQTPPGLHLSPRMQSDRGQNDNHRQVFQQESVHNVISSFRPSQQAPILIAPNPQSLRPATGPFRQHSLPSSGSPPAKLLHPTAFAQSNVSISSQGKKSQKKIDPGYNEYYTVISTPELRAELNEQDLLMLELRHKDRLQWKELAITFGRKISKNKETAALQMRRKRLMAKAYETANEIAGRTQDTAKWDAICKVLHKYAPRRPSKQVAPKKWHEMNAPYGVQYDMQHRQRHRASSDLTSDSFDHDSWSDGRESTEHSLHDSDPGELLSTIASATMNEVRSRAASDASIQQHLQQQQQQQQQQHHHHQQQQQQHQEMMYAQQRQSGWDPRHSA
ncbi:hypothetical protein EG329_006065 [Mollisiaceae sp. DMI_Dod_QoI]|nr:hypothetical protein EG329_006065 [Helotiales sp. DMI_Dod_QoI]